MITLNTAGPCDAHDPGAFDPGQPLLIMADGVCLERAVFLERASRVARALPDDVTRIINLCEHRDRFLLGFCAALLKGRTTVMPPSRAPRVVRETIDIVGGAGTLDDADVERALAGAAPVAPVRDLDTIAAGFIAAIGFTSGSTGVPAAHPKPWSALRASACLNAARIGEALAERSLAAVPGIVATVPPQHMYGMELSVLQPLLAGMTIHASRPLLPADVAATLAQVPVPRVLVTTPVHLRALVESRLPYVETAVVVSATAPLAPELARSVERAFGATVVEMFGATETCVIASRRTASETAWRPYPEVELEHDGDQTLVRAPWFASPTTIQDVIELRDDGCFTLVGRSGDMIEIAGKRASLADLTKRLLSVPGVRDAAIFVPGAARPGAVARVAALAVAPGCDARQILADFAQRVEFAFLPRPLVLVPELPRNETGKVTRERLLGALDAHRGARGAGERSEGRMPPARGGSGKR
jgi:acyl-coenzyme A synthetase/AMP-(fatty) acid ligase